MINFFRETRKKLTDDNKPLKYLTYAIGEIVLVVIGILIALQINNWNENRKEKIIEKQYLERLLLDLNVDNEYYSERITKIELANEQLSIYIEMSYKTQNSIEEFKQLISHLHLNTDHLTTANSTFRELTSTGMMKVFKNEFLKKSIIDYYRINEELSIQIKEFNLVSTEYLIQASRIAPSWIKYFPDSKLFKDPNMFLDGEWEFINDPSSFKFQTLESMVNTYWYRNTEHLNFFYKLKSITKDLQSQIIEDLKSNN